MRSVSTDEAGPVESEDLPPRSQAIARIALVAVLAGLGLWTIRAFLPSLVWATILALALWPLYRRVERRWPGGGPGIALPAVFTALVALVFVVPLLLAIWQAAREAHDLLQWVRDVQASGAPVPDWVKRLPVGAEQAEAWWRTNLEQPGDASDVWRRLNRETLLSLTRELGVEVAHRSILFAFTLMTLFFLFRDGRVLRNELARASHKLFGPRGERVARHMVASVHGTVNGLVLVGLGEGLAMGIAYVVAGVPHPVLLGVLTAVAAMIPFGAPLVFAIAAALLVAQGAALAAIAVVAIGLVVVGIADHVFRPMLIGGATRLPFVWVLFGILGGVETWGLLGLFLGPAIMAALILLWREFADEPSTHADPA